MLKINDKNVANNDVDRHDEADNHISDHHDEASWEKATRGFFQSTQEPPSSES